MDHLSVYLYMCQSICIHEAHSAHDPHCTPANTNPAVGDLRNLDYVHVNGVGLRDLAATSDLES